MLADARRLELAMDVSNEREALLHEQFLATNKHASAASGLLEQAFPRCVCVCVSVCHCVSSVRL